MSPWYPFSRLIRLPRVWIWIAILAVIAFATLGNPASWAAPVISPPNQTVPPGQTSTYLPSIHRANPNLIVALEENGGFSTLLQTLEAANLTAALEGATTFTLFAPTDAAFAGLPAGALDQLLANPSGQLTQILLFHIVPGRYEIDDLENGMQITTQQGSSIQVDRSMEPDIFINGAKIITPTLGANNGVIHAIDAVILPPPDSIR